MSAAALPPALPRPLRIAAAVAAATRQQVPTYLGKALLWLCRKTFVSWCTSTTFSPRCQNSSHSIRQLSFELELESSPYALTSWLPDSGLRCECECSQRLVSKCCGGKPAQVRAASGGYRSWPERTTWTVEASLASGLGVANLGRGAGRRGSCAGGAPATPR